MSRPSVAPFPVMRITPASSSRLLSLLVLLCALSFGTAPAQESRTTAEVFRRFSDRVVKVQVVETGSSAKAIIGSGFFVSAQGHVLTNYHVVSKLVHAPERYRVELIDSDGATMPAAVAGVSVVHDLAVLTTTLRPAAHFALGAVQVRQGERLFSLGNPHDLGLSIVEGTYNGHLRHTLYPRIHFTGSLNSGMSGGPTITAAGTVVGINVSTVGSQVSFLVPVERAIELVNAVLAPGYAPPARMLDAVGHQLRDFQEDFLRGMFTGEMKTVDLGRYRVVTEPAPFFRCWADADRSPEQPYESVRHRCSTDDNVFIAGEQTSGVVHLEHRLISTRTLNSSRFFALYTSMFSHDNTPWGWEEHVTEWRCRSRNIRNDSATMRAVLCVRRYKKLGELYDAVLKVAVLGRGDSGLVSTLGMSGVTFENAEQLSRRYLERLEWR
jgi:serine protease Do